MAADGFKRYQAFFERPPAIVVEWHDDKTDARGWLCIDSLEGGAAGGGTRMRDRGSREEAVFLAKTMGVKFRVCGPTIGGGKSVIRFDPHARPKEKRGVLERWYRHVGAYLRECYGTGGDVNVDEVSEASAITEQVLGIGHPQEGICRGHYGGEVGERVRRLKAGCEATVVLEGLPGPRGGAWMVADVVTGYGVARAIERRAAVLGERLEGRRVVIEGFGAVGAFAAYYLARSGVKLVATSTRDSRGYRVAVNESGFDVNALIASRDGTALPAPRGKKSHVVASKDAGELFDVPADIFVPAAASHTLTAKRVRQLRKAGVKVWSCGANNPFAYKTKRADVGRWVSDMAALQRDADKRFAIIPDFVANCGMARTFAFLMSDAGTTDARSILADTGAAIDGAVDRLLAGHRKAVGLLEKGYTEFVPG